MRVWATVCFTVLAIGLLLAYIRRGDPGVNMRLESKKRAETSEPADDNLALHRLLVSSAIHAQKDGTRAEAEFLAAHALQIKPSALAGGILAAIAVESRPSLLSTPDVSGCQRFGASRDGRYITCWWSDGVKVMDTSRPGPARDVWSHTDVPDAVAVLESSGHIIARFPGHTFVSHVEYSGRWQREIPALSKGPYPTARRVIGWNRSMVAVDPNSGEFQRLGACLSSIDPAFSRDDQMVASVCSASSFSLVTGGAVERYSVDPPLGSAASSIAFHPNGSRLIVIDTEGELSQVEVRTGKRSIIRRTSARDRPGLRLSPDGATIAVSDARTGVVLYSLLGRYLTRLPMTYGVSAAFRSANELLTLGHSAAIWALPERYSPHHLTEHANDIRSAHVSPNGADVFVSYGAANGAVVRRFISSASPDTPELITNTSPGGFQTAAFHPNGQTLVVGDASTDRLKRIDIAQDDHRAIHLPAPKRIVWSAQDEVMVLNNSPTRLERFDATSLELLGQCEGTGWVDLSASPDARTIVALASGGRSFRVERGAQCPTYRHDAPDATTVATSNDAQLTVTATDQRLVLWDDANALQGEIVVSTGLLARVAVSADAEWLVAALDTGQINVWSAHTRELVGQSHVHRAQAHSLQFLKQGATLMSASRDVGVRFWDLGVLNVEPRYHLQSLGKVYGLDLRRAVYPFH